MKKLAKISIVAVIMIIIAAGTIFAADTTTIPIQKIVEVVPVRHDPSQPDCSIAMQAVWDPKRLTWRRQIIPFNGATAEMVTEEMKKLAAEKLVPNRNGIMDWESWKFTIIYPTDGAPARIIPKSETVIAPVAKPAPAPPVATVDPNAALRANIEVVKAKTAALEAAETKRQKDAEDAAKIKAELDAIRTKNAAKAAMPAAVVKPRPKVVTIAKELAECKERATNLEKAELDATKSGEECQTALSTAQEDNKKLQKKYDDLQKNSDDATVELQKELAVAKRQPSLILLSILGLLALFSGMLIMYSIMSSRAKKADTDKK